MVRSRLTAADNAPLIERGHSRTSPDGRRRRRSATAGQSGDVTLNFVDTDIREIARTILGTTLNLNYTIDPNVRGTGSIETGTPLPRSALLPALEALLNQNGATLVERAGVYAVVPLAAGATRNLVSGANAIGAGTQIVPLQYASAKDLAKVLEPYVAEGGKIAADPARNALIVSRRRGGAPDPGRSDPGFRHRHSGRPVLCPLPDRRRRPGKRASELERVLQAQDEGRARRLGPGHPDGSGQCRSRGLVAAALH